MKFFRVWKIAFVSLFLTSPAFAQSGDVSLSFENWSGTGVAGHSLTAAARNDFTVPPPFGLQGDLSYRDHMIGGTAYDTLNGTLHAYWAVPTGGKVGLFASYSDISSTPSGTLKSYGGEVIYNLAALNLEAWAGAGVLETGQTIDFTLVGAELVYPLSPTMQLFARLNRIDASGSANDVTDQTIGVDWTPGPMTFTASVGTADIGGQNATRVGIAISIPFGGGSGSKRTSFFEAARGAYRY